ncbi:Mdm33 family-domain-containing protein [Chaetomium tenue]|uniref:Mdm33 family-domain-containing protein n=1 Tax=Chaetomium tenue TaxID=1854479 RepID=A0ACB7PAA7_9PEZI|nr:Mdm33 family-domain-containing protein [Chaetomium globosum]
MSAHTAFRLAARPLQRGTFINQLVAISARKQPSNRPSTCLGCSIPAHPGTGPGPVRLFSTAPPPPRKPPPPPPEATPDDSSTEPKPEPAALGDSPSTASPTPPKQSGQPPQPEPEPSPASTTTTTSSSKPPSPKEPSLEPPPQEQPPKPDSPTTPPPQPEPPSQDPSLPSFTETHRHPLSARFSTMMDNLQSRAVTATQTINDLTGYTSIEAIKARNTQLETEHAAAQHRLHAARHNYKSLTSHRASTQREVTTLLARKDTWNPADLERFTTLYRLDHELETQVSAAAEELTAAETDESRLGGELNAGILKRYHEEQIWSDRIRRQSTWGTWGLMGVNILLFLGLQFVAEPWRRRRLVNGIVESERGVMDEVRRELAEVRAVLERGGVREEEQEEGHARVAAAAAVGEGLGFDASSAGEVGSRAAAAAAAPAATAPVEAEEWNPPSRPWKELLMDFWEDPELIREAVLDLSSDRRIDLRMRDASLIALQGAAAGAAVTVVVVFSILRNT